MRAFRPVFAFAMALALALALRAKTPMPAGPIPAAGYGGGGAQTVVAVSINFPSGSVGGVDCASLSACIADTRSTTATYVTGLAALSTAAVNTPRIDCSNGTCGLLNEGASTNLALYSANIGGTGLGHGRFRLRHAQRDAKRLGRAGRRDDGDASGAPADDRRQWKLFDRLLERHVRFSIDQLHSIELP